MIFLHKCQKNLKDFLIFFYPKHAIQIRNDLMRTPCIETGYRISLFILSNRELSFIPVMKRMLHPADRLHNRFNSFLCKSSQTYEIVFYFILLEAKLFFIRHRLNLTSSTLSCHRTRRRNAIWGRRKNFH